MADGDSKQQIYWINKYRWFIDVYLLSIDIYRMLKGLINKASFFHRCYQRNGDFTTKLGIDMSTSAPATSKIDMKTLVNLGYSNHGNWQWGILSFFSFLMGESSVLSRRATSQGCGLRPGARSGLVFSSIHLEIKGGRPRDVWLVFLRSNCDKMITAGEI